MSESDVAQLFGEEVVDGDLDGEGDAWKEVLKKAAVTYVDADEAIKSVNKEIKPLREQRTTSRESLMAIMGKMGLGKVRVSDIGVQFQLKTQKYKLGLTKERLRELCFKFFAGDQASAERLFAFLSEPVYEERVTLRRKKEAGQENASH